MSHVTMGVLLYYVYHWWWSTSFNLYYVVHVTVLGLLRILVLMVIRVD